MRRFTPGVRTLSLIVAAATLVTGLAACSSSTPTPTPATTKAAADTFPATVGTLTLAAKPTRIVSLSPTATEMLFAIAAGPQVVAVDSYSDFPANAPKTDLSAYKPNVEAIAKYAPDLVVVTDNSDKIVDQLAALKVPTFVAPAATTLDDTYQQLADLGTLTGHKADAAALVGQLKGDIGKLVTDLPKRSTPLTYYYELDQTYYSVTSATFIGSLFKLAGFTNIADASGSATNAYPQLSAESIIKANPDVIFLADTKCCAQSADTVAKRSGWSGLTAVKTGMVVPLDDDIASRWGPRVVDLLRAITDAAAKAPVG